MATETPAAEAPLDPEEKGPQPPLLHGPSSPPAPTASASVAEEAPVGAPDVVATYLGASFAVFLGLLPAIASSHHLRALQARARSQALQLARADEQIRQMRARRKEDCRANARVVEIFAGHRSQWQREERRLAGEVEVLRERLKGAEKEREALRADVEELRREVEERDEVIEAMTRDGDEEEEEEDGSGTEEDFVEKEVEMGRAGRVGFAFGRDNAYAEGSACHQKLEDPEEEQDFDGRNQGAAASAAGFEDYNQLGYAGAPTRFAMPTRSLVSSRGGGASPDLCFRGGSGEMGPQAYPAAAVAAAVAAYYAAAQCGVFGTDFFSPPLPKSWADKTQHLQDMVHESLESLYPTKHLVSRRNNPWKIDGESSGVSSKLKRLEQELANLEVSTTGGVELCKIHASMRKHAKRYQTLAGKVDDLCKRMQVSDPSEPTLSPEFRSQRQTDFLVEAHRLQQRASETRQKLMTLQVEAASCLTGADDQPVGKAKVNARKSLESIKTHLKEIQRSLEVWVARIMGDIEGIMAREGAPRITDYYLSRYTVR